MTKFLWSSRKHFMWFPWSFTKYQLSEDRFFVEKGLFSTTFDETQLYRILDVKLKRSFGQKIFGTGTIELTSRDPENPKIYVENVKNSYDVKEMLVHLVEKARKENRVLTTDSMVNYEDMSDEDGDGIPDVFQK